MPTQNLKPPSKIYPSTTGTLRRFVFLILLFAFGCAADLSPQYNQAIVDNLSDVSKETLSLIASVSSGTKPQDFSSRESSYNKVIGISEALKLQLQARPLPQGKVLDKLLKKINEHLKAKKLPAVTDIAPSFKAIENVIENVTKMKETDKAQGLTPLEVTAFKGNIVLYLDQALTYETFLNTK